jgi:hypothetical protein
MQMCSVSLLGLLALVCLLRVSLRFLFIRVFKAFYLPLISHVRTLLSHAKKKSYTISVGKLNPAKLANFLEIECFVLVACPENSLINTKVGWTLCFRISLIVLSKGFSKANCHSI